MLAESEQWARLREAILPQLATAIESATLVDEIRKKLVQTVGALARSMEAKDYYTGGHTERVSDIAVALADAARLHRASSSTPIEIGALLHDIGKIGIPERILHKPGPLDDEEWKVMKEHPVISDYILPGRRPRTRSCSRSPGRATSASTDGATRTGSTARPSRCRRASSSSPTRSTP